MYMYIHFSLLYISLGKRRTVGTKNDEPSGKKGGMSEGMRRTNLIAPMECLRVGITDNLKRDYVYDGRLSYFKVARR